jgi:hypothetical protein
MKRRMRLLPVLAAGFLLAALPAPLQTPAPEVRLRLQRDFGFSGSGRMQGTFTLSAEGVDDPASVDYLIDGEIMARLKVSPFRHTFSTSMYAPGEHQLQAVLVTRAGQILSSPTSRFVFLTAEEAQRRTLQLLLPLGGCVLLFTLLGVLTTALLTGKRRAFRPGQYGPAGGAVCPRCALPFSRHVLSLHLLFGNLERCPHCHAWAVVLAASRAALQAAEVRAAQARPLSAPAAGDEAARLRRRVEDTRFFDDG